MSGRRRFLLPSVLSLCSLCLCGEILYAHPIPNSNHDRVIEVRLTPDAVLVDYGLEVSEVTAATELPREEIAKVNAASEFHPVFLRYFSGVIADNLVAKLDDEELPFACVRRTYDAATNIHHFRFKAPWKPAAGAAHVFTFYEGNYYGDDYSGLRLTFAADDAVRLADVKAPSEELMARPFAERKPLDGEKLRRLSARVAVGDAAPDPTPPAVAPAAPPNKSDAPADKDGAPKKAESPEVEEDQPTAAAKEAAPRDLKDLLLDASRYGVVLLLLAAALLGAAHALTPGHGKTLVAAYLVGERGTIWHALLLGLITTLTHTGIVLIFAIVLAFCPNLPLGPVQQALELTGGLLVAGLGFWLLTRRLSGKADHVHLGGGHHHHHHGHDHSHDHGQDHDHHHHHGEFHHHHDHNHAHAVQTAGAGVTASPAAAVTTAAPEAPAVTKVGLCPLIVLGVKGGIVPCWDAIALLAVAVSKGMLALALPLLLAFSAGLAGVLVSLGVAVVLARKVAGSVRPGWGKRFRGVAKVLPMITAVLIMVIGLWLCYESLRAAG